MSLLYSSVRWGIYALMLTPLVFWKSLDFFFESTKGFFIMGVIELTFLAYLWLVYLCPEFRPKIGRVGTAFFIYILVLILASVFGVDPFVSFWSNTDRVGGVILWLHFAALFLMVTSIFRSSRDWQQFFQFSNWIGIIVSFIFLLTRIFPTFFEYSRGGSTFGNSSFFGLYLIFCLFFSALLALIGESKRIRGFGGASFIFFFVVLWITGALAAKYAVLGGLVLGIALWLIIRGRSNFKKVIGWLFVVALSVGFILSVFQFFQSDSAARQWFVEQSSGSRFAVWSVAWESWKERPILGWGLDNFSVAFLDQYNACFGSTECGGEEYWFDRAHNKILDTLVEAGLVGLVSYLLLLGVCLWAVWNAYRRSKLPWPVPILVTTFFAVHFVEGIAEFDLAFSYLLFMFVVAYIQTISESQPKGSSRRCSKSLGAVACVATVLLPFAFFHTVIFPIQTNQTYLVVNAMTVGERREAYEAQVFGSPIGQDYRRVYLAAETAKWILRLPDEERELFAQALQSELATGIAGLSETVERSPNNLKATNLLGILYHLDGHYFHPAQLERAEEVLSQSLKKNFQNQHAYAALSAVYLEQGRVAEALDLLQEAIELYPSVPQSFLRLLAAIRLTADQTTYEQKKAEILQRFPYLEDEVAILSQMWEQNPDQLYGIFY